MPSPVPKTGIKLNRTFKLATLDDEQQFLNISFNAKIEKMVANELNEEYIKKQLADAKYLGHFDNIDTNS